MEELIPKFSIFLLVFVRVASFFVVMPLFSYRALPAMYRMGLAFYLSWIMYYSISAQPLAIDGDYFMLIIKEALVGLAVGFCAYMIMSAIQIAGGLIDFQMGFAIANVIDPQTGAQSPLMGQYLYMFSMLLLLSLDGHHLILDGIFYSYQFIPLELSGLHLGSAGLAEYIIKAFSGMFMSAFQMAAPVVAVLFLVDVALGIVARTVPQLNVFVVGFPIKIAVSFIVLFIVMGVMMGVVQQLFGNMLVTMRNVMELLGGGGS